MMDSNQPSGNKRQFLFIIKFILLIFISYFMVQISIVSKEIEEKRPIPGLQTTMELADQYMKGKYWMDWRHLGSDFNYPDAHLSSYHYLELSSDVGMLQVYPYDFMRFDFPHEKDHCLIRNYLSIDSKSIGIWIVYGMDILHIKAKDISGEYYIEYQNGSYIPNPQMEQETGFTTEEIVEQAYKMRTAFEEEMEKMHQYQIGRAKERRKKFTNFGFVTFLLFCTLYSLVKWAVINKRANAEDKYPEEVLKETMAKAREKLLKRRYLLLGCVISFWIHILIPVISEYILIPIGGNANEYTAYGISAVISPIAYASYGISAVITAVVLGLLWESPVIEKRNAAGTAMQAVKYIVWFLLGCAVTLAVIWLGISIVPRLFCPLVRFYIINLIADGIAFLVFIMIEAAKRPAAGVGHDGTMAMEKGDLGNGTQSTGK